MLCRSGRALPVAGSFAMTAQKSSSNFMVCAPSVSRDAMTPDFCGRRMPMMTGCWARLTRCKGRLSMLINMWQAAMATNARTSMHGAEACAHLVLADPPLKEVGLASAETKVNTCQDT